MPAVEAETPRKMFPPPITTATTPLRYRRILLKLSGEALMGDGRYGIHPPTLVRIAHEIGEVVKAGVQIAVVIGGGNIFRGVSASTAGMDRANADYMGICLLYTSPSPR